MTHAVARGDRVIATARSLEKLEKSIAESDIKDVDRVRALQLDVTDGEEKVKAQIDEAVGFWGRIDVLVNNAGMVILAIPLKKVSYTSLQDTDFQDLWKKEG